MNTEVFPYVLPAFQEAYQKFVVAPLPTVSADIQGFANSKITENGFARVSGIKDYLKMIDEDPDISFLRTKGTRTLLAPMKTTLRDRIDLLIDSEEVYIQRTRKKTGEVKRTYKGEEFEKKIQGEAFSGDFTATHLKTGILNYLIHAPIGDTHTFLNLPPLYRAKPIAPKPRVIREGSTTPEVSRA